MQTVFNVDTDGGRLIDECFPRCFGAAGDPLKRFYCRISEINREEGVPGTSEKASWEKLGTEERMRELGALMDRAAWRTCPGQVRAIRSTSCALKASAAFCRAAGLATSATG